MKSNPEEKSFYMKYRVPLLYFSILILAIGIYFYFKINVSLFPDITFPKIKLIAENGEQPIDKMMITVTKPIEEAIKKIPDLQLVRSTTSRGSCEISAFLDWKSDINISQQQLESRINQIRVNLPPETNITVEQMNPSVLPVMCFILESNVKSQIELKQIANYTVKPLMSQIEGISQIQVAGGKEKEYWVELKPGIMSSMRITPPVVRDAFTKTNFITANGLISDFRRLYLTLTDAQVYDINDIENIVIQNDGKRQVLLKDIADISVNEKIENVNINVDGHDGVLVNVLKQPNANLVEVSGSIKSKSDELQKLLPQGVTIKLYYDQADFVNTSIRSVSDALWIGLLFAIFVTFAFLRSLKASLTVLCTIPVTIAFTLIILYIFNYTFNLMTLGAIAASVGLIIDDAIVVIEQIHRIKEETSGESNPAVVHRAVSFLFPAMLGSSLSTIVIFLPFSFMSGVAGAYFKILAYTMIITLVCSFFVVWLGLPAVYLLFNKKFSTDKSAQRKKSDNKYLRYFLLHPLYSVFLIIAMILSAIIIVPKLSTGFLPEMDEGSIVLDYFSPPGTSLEETNSILKKVDNILETVPEVEHYSRRIGTQLGFFITEPNKGDYLISLKKDKSRTTNDVIDEIRTKIESIQLPLTVDFGQMVNDMLGDLMSSVQPVEVNIFGDKPEVLKSYAEKISSEVESVDGTADVFNGITIAGPTIDFKPKSQELSRYNLSPEDLSFKLQNLVEGNIVGVFPEKLQMTNIRMFESGYRTKDINLISNSDLILQDGTTLKLKDLADFNITSGEAEIERENLKTVLKITGRLNKRDLGSVMKDIKQKISSDIYLPQGFSISYGGAYEEQQKSFSELLTILITAGLLVLSVLLFLFRDVKGSVIILFVSLLGISGSFLFLYLANVPLNVGSYMGVIMIVGIVAENATFTFHRFKNSLNSMNVTESLVEAVSVRLRPNLMTALGAIIALMPLALALGSGAQMHQPLAIAVIGGFIIGLPIQLIVFPAILRIFYSDFLKKKFRDED